MRLLRLKIAGALVSEGHNVTTPNEEKLLKYEGVAKQFRKRLELTNEANPAPSSIFNTARLYLSSK
jgi:hypothetical protein